VDSGSDAGSQRADSGSPDAAGQAQDLGLADATPADASGTNDAAGGADTDPQRPDAELDAGNDASGRTDTGRAPQAAHILMIGASDPSDPIAPLLGVNAGPRPSGDDGNADLTDRYRALGVTHVRTHDYYEKLDVHVMYPDHTADPSRRASFDLADSDVYWQGILDSGVEPTLDAVVGEDPASGELAVLVVNRTAEASSWQPVLRGQTGWSGYAATLRQVRVDEDGRREVAVQEPPFPIAPWTVQLLVLRPVGGAGQ